MKVYVYRNLHKNLWSVKALEGPDKGRVIDRPESVVLHNVEFRVSEAGRQRVLREQRKNVHAGAVGQLDPGAGDRVPEGDSISYNPYRGASFYRRADDLPISSADDVLFDYDGKVYARNAR